MPSAAAHPHPHPHPHPPAPARAAAARFGLFWFGEGVSALGSATSAVLIPLLAVVGLHAGPVWMGSLTAAVWAPWLVVGLPAGVWVDRWPPRPVMIAADLTSAVAVLTLPVAAGLGVLSLPHLLVVALVTGVASVFFQTARVALVPRLVPTSELERANSRLLGTESAVQVAGPGVAGAVLSVLSAAAGLVLDAASFLVSAGCLAFVRERARQPDRDAVPVAAAAITPASTAGWPRRLTEGLGWVLRDRHLRLLMVVGGVSNVGLTGYATLLVLYLVDTVGVAPGTVGVLLAVAQVGGLLGAALVGRLSRRIGAGRASTLLLVLSAPSALLVGLAAAPGQVWLTVTGLFLVAATVVGGNVVRGAWRQRYVPSAALARTVTAMQLVNYGGMPLAALAAGFLGAHLGVRPTVLLMATVHAVACLSVVPTRFGRGRALPSPAEFSGWGTSDGRAG